MTDHIRIGFTRETTHGTRPLRERFPIDLKGADLPPLCTYPELIGRAVVACPNCGGEVRTETAFMRTPIDSGLRFQGCRCLECGKSYTVELTEAPLE